MNSLKQIYSIASTVTDLLGKFQEIKTICRKHIEGQQQYMNAVRLTSKKIEFIAGINSTHEKDSKNKEKSRLTSALPDERSNFSLQSFGLSKKVQKSIKIQNKTQSKASEKTQDKVKEKKKNSKRSRDLTDKPKKPLGPYFLFLNKVRNQFKEHDPSKTFGKQHTQEVQQEWSTMDSEDKQNWKEEYNKKLRIYEQKISEWYIKHPEQRPQKKEKTGKQSPTKNHSIMNESASEENFSSKQRQHDTKVDGESSEYEV